jgi:thiol-disulfide isomerase/thioredoxin
MRAPVDTIAAPLFPTKLPWVNSSVPQATIQRGKPMIVEFWDFCRPSSLRTLPYVQAWHERYAEHGLRTIGVHSPGFDPSRDERAVREAVERLGIEYPVLIDGELEVWQEYENAGWPARYLFDGRGRLFEYHYGEGAYAETERAIQELLGVPAREPVPPLRPEDVPDARVVPQTQDQEGAYSGRYEAGGAWAVLDGSGTVRVHAGLAAEGLAEAGDAAAAEPAGSPTIELNVTHPGAYPLIEHVRHTEGIIELELGPGVRCYATCFTPGVAPPGD